MYSTRFFRVPALLLALILVAQAPGTAQQAPKQLLTLNPIGAIFGVYNGEVERAITPNASLAVSASYWGSELETADGSAGAGISYLSADFKGRYYPGTALQGFSFGGLVGFTSLGGDVRACDATDTECLEAEGRVNSLSAGVEIDYTFLMGQQNNWGLAVGLGGKRLFPMGADVDVTLAYPFGRLSIGYAF